MSLAGVVEQVANGDWLLAVGAWPARANAPAPCVAVRAALFTEVAGLAVGAFVDGRVLGGQDGSGCGGSAAPRGLAAGVGAPLSAPERCEPFATLPTRYRRGIVTHAAHRGFPALHVVAASLHTGRRVGVGAGSGGVDARHERACDDGSVFVVPCVLVLGGGNVTDRGMQPAVVVLMRVILSSGLVGGVVFEAVE